MSLTDDESDPGEFQDIFGKDYQQIKNKAMKLGYADGVAKGRDSVFQQGFDLGYKDGLRTSFEIDKYRNFFANLNLDKMEDKAQWQNEKDIFSSLHIKESKSPDHFQYVKHKDQSLEVISKAQHKYIDEVADHLVNNLPHASILLQTQ